LWGGGVRVGLEGRVDVVERLEAGEVRSAVEWAQVRALAADGVSNRQIAARLGINRRTVDRLIAAEEPPRYRRAPAGSMLDPLEPVLARLLEEWPEIKAPRVTEILRCDYGYAVCGGAGAGGELPAHRAQAWSPATTIRCS
jgi:hypothetical protein